MSPYTLTAAALLACALALPAAAEEPAASKAAQPPSPVETELKTLTTENQLSEQRLKKKLQQANEEKEALRAQSELDAQKQRGRTAALEADLALAVSENKLSEEKNKKALAELALKLARLKADNDLKAEQHRSDALAETREKNAMDLEMKRLDLEERRLKLEKIALDNRAVKLASDLELRSKRSEWKKEANSEPVYTDRPFRDGKLIISDRRIPLNGPIRYGSSEYVTERINYFNNISTQPIFIVIEDSPGGSSSEGYAILKAMESSKAPVYVAVKSYAASMAAIITTLAERSYIYPGAKLLHHQASGMMYGNTTQRKEQLELARETEKRLIAPVAKKMGISMDEFRKQMYENNSDGDWMEFGDKAVQHKWVTGLVEKIEETGIVKNPDEAAATPRNRGMAGFELQEKTDEKGRVYVTLPRLKPFDFYFLYDPDEYYRY